MTTKEFNQLLMDNIEYIRPYSVFYTRDEENAKDLLQETICKALLNQDKYRNGKNIKGWLLTIMRNIFFNNYRRKRIEHRIFHQGGSRDISWHAQAGASAQPASHGAETREILSAVHTLPENLRIPFYLQYEGYKYQEIAAIVNTAEGTIKSRIHLARKTLMKKVG